MRTRFGYMCNANGFTVRHLARALEIVLSVHSSSCVWLLFVDSIDKTEFSWCLNMICCWDIIRRGKCVSLVPRSEHDIKYQRLMYYFPIE